MKVFKFFYDAQNCRKYNTGVKVFGLNWELKTHLYKIRSLILNDFHRGLNGGEENFTLYAYIGAYVNNQESGILEFDCCRTIMLGISIVFLHG